jgi:hypothetical protein
VLEAIVSSALTLRVRQLSRPHLTAPAPDARLVLDADRRRTAALPPGARILAIDGRRVETTDEARTILRRARPPTMLYVEDARGRYFYALEAPR